MARIIAVPLRATAAGGEVIDLTEDIEPNYDYFIDGPGYDALDME